MEKSDNKKEISNIFFGKYKAIKKIGSGSFGYVFKGINLSDQKNVAIKIEKKDTNINLLQKESYYLYQLKGIGIPDIISYGYSGNYNVLIMTLLGESLGKIFYKNGNFFPLKDICMFTIQILHRIEYVHSKYLIHRDIKPENFLIGEPDKYMIYVIDFGLSKKYKSSRTNKHIQFKLTKKFTGTARYASINAVRGAEQSRRDDLEAIGYMLMYFFNRGKLPWQGVSCKERAEKYGKIYNMKKNLNYEEFCKNMPREIIEYMRYCKELKFEEKPDYDYLRNLFELALKKNNMVNDLKFSWIEDYSIIKNLEEIKNKIAPTNNIKRKASPQSRIYKKLESSRESNKEKDSEYKILINNNSQKYFENINPINKVQTHNFKINLGHRKFNSSWDAMALLKNKDSEMIKSSVAKYNMSIDDNNYNSNFNDKENDRYNYINNDNKIENIDIRNIIEKNNNLIISNNGRKLNKDINKNNNLFYFSNNFNDLSKSLVVKNNSNENTNIRKQNTFINNSNKKNTNVNNNNNKSNNSPNIIKSLSYVKKDKNKIEEIKINFNESKILNNNMKYKNLNNIIISNTQNNKINNKSNIIYNKKKSNIIKINNLKKNSINNVINNNININQILVNKNKNLITSKIKIKKLGYSNSTRNKKGKIIKRKPSNIIIQTSPTNNNINSKSSSNIFKKSTFTQNNTRVTNNLHQNIPYYFNINNKLSSSNLKKVPTKIHHLSKNNFNSNTNIEGKINKIKNMNIHSNIKKDSFSNQKNISTEVIFKNNNMDILTNMNQNQKRINKYKNIRHKITKKNNNLTLQKNLSNNNTRAIPKVRMTPKTISSTLNNSNTINNTINTNNNNNTIISIYNNYNINKNNYTSGIYKNHNSINITLDTLNNKEKNNKYFSYNGYNVNNFNNYIHSNPRKNFTLTNGQNRLDNYPSLNAGFDSNILEGNIIQGNDMSFQENYLNNNLKNYFSINDDISKNEHKKNKLLSISSLRPNFNTCKIKKIFNEIKYNNSNNNLLNKNHKKKFSYSNSNLLENKQKRFHINNNIINSHRSNSFLIKDNLNSINCNKTNNNIKQRFDCEHHYPSINRKKTDIFYQKLPQFKINFNIDDSNLIQERNNTPRFRRYEHNKNYFDFPNIIDENQYLSLKF